MQSHRRNPYETPQGPRMNFTQDTQTHYDNIDRMLASTPQPQQQQKQVWNFLSGNFSATWIFWNAPSGRSEGQKFIIIFYFLRQLLPLRRNKFSRKRRLCAKLLPNCGNPTRQSRCVPMSQQPCPMHAFRWHVAHCRPKRNGRREDTTERRRRNTGVTLRRRKTRRRQRTGLVN